MHLEPVAVAPVGEHHDVAVGGGDVELLDEVAVAGGHAGPALAAAVLGAVEAERRPLDVAGPGDRDHHVLVGDHVLDRDVRGVGHDLGAPRVAVALLDLVELAPDLLKQQGVGTEDRAQTLDLGDQLAVLLLDLLPLEAGQPLQAHVQDRLRLGLAQREALDQALPGFRRGAASADRRDHRVQVVERDEQPFEDVGALLGPGQVVAAAPDHDRAAMVEEVAQQGAQGQHLGLAVDDRQHVHAVADLELGHLVERVQNDLGHLAPLQVDHDPDAVAVGLVAQVADAFELLLAHQLGDPLDQAGLVHLEGKLGHDDRLTVLAGILDLGAGPHLDGATARGVGGMDARAAMDEAAGREVRPGQQLHQLFQGRLGAVDQQLDRRERLAQVVRRDVRRHADGDAGRAVDQQVRDPRRKRRRLLLGTVVVRYPLDGVLLDVLAQQLLGDPGQADLRVAHRGRVVAVDRAEVALAVHQRIAHGEVLRHPHHRVVDRSVAVRVVLAHHVADDARRLLVGAAGRVAGFPHAVEHPPVNRLEAVPHVGQGAADDHAHRVIEVAPPHLALELHRHGVAAGRRRRLDGVLALAHGRWVRCRGWSRSGRSSR